MRLRLGRPANVARRTRTAGPRVGAILAAGIAVALGCAAYLADVWGPWEGDSVDLRFALREEAPPDDVIVIAIDDSTFSKLEDPMALSPFAPRRRDRPPPSCGREADRL